MVDSAPGLTRYRSRGVLSTNSVNASNERVLLMFLTFFANSSVFQEAFSTFENPFQSEFSV